MRLSQGSRDMKCCSLRARQKIVPRHWRIRNTRGETARELRFDDCVGVEVSERTESRKLVTHALSWSWTGMSKHSGNGRDMPKLGPTLVFMGRHVVFNQVKWNAALSGLERYEMLLSQGSAELKWSVLTKKIMCINVTALHVKKSSHRYRCV